MSKAIIKIENEANFSPSEQLILLAQQDVQIHIKNRLELEKEIIELLYKIYYASGYNIDAQEMKLLAPVVISDLLRSFRFYTVKEVEIAFYNGSRGEYGEFVGLNAVRFNHWIKSYMTDKKRLDAIAKQKRLIEQEYKPQISEEELFKRSVKFAIDAFEEFKKNGYYNDLGNAVYEFLDGLKLIPFSNERKWEIFEEAKKRIIARNDPKQAINQIERSAFLRVLESIEAAGKEPIELVRVEARKIALNIFFKDLEEMEIELSELIEPNNI